MALIFIADPRPSVAKQCRTVLMSRGHRVQAFHHFDAFFKSLATDKPDLVLVNSDAFAKTKPAELVSQLKSRCNTAAIMLSLSNRRDEKSMLAAIEAGVDDIILTPMIQAEVAARVTAALRSKRRQEALTSRPIAPPTATPASSSRIARRQGPLGSARLRGRNAVKSNTSAPKSRMSSQSARPLPPRRDRPSSSDSVTDVLISGQLSADGVLKHALNRDDAKIAGRIFDAYRLVKTLGVGGMGVVLEAVHRETGRRMALKILRSDIEGEPEAPMRFLREVYVLQGLKAPNVIRLEDIGRAGGTIFYAMEFVDGETLADLLDDRQRLSVREALRIALGIARALVILAEAGLVHRDIKPANIFVARDGKTVKLGDFGLAKRAFARDVTPRKSLIGTPHYIAPEVIAGEPATSASDIYSLGVCFHEMLSGKTLYPVKQTATLLYDIVYGQPPDVSKALRDVPESVTDIVEMAVRRYPEQRFENAAEFADRLADLLRRFG